LFILTDEKLSENEKKKALRHTISIKLHILETCLSLR
jgi:hypothetical protein